MRKNRAKELRSFRRNSGRRTHKNCVNSPGVVSQTARPPFSSIRSRCAFSCRIMRESSVEITQNLRKNQAKKLQKFWKFGTPRAQKLRSLGHRALRILQMSLRVDRVSIAFRSEERRRPASASRKFCAQLARKNCKFLENYRRAARAKGA